MRWWRRRAGVRTRSTLAAAAVVAVALLAGLGAAWWLLRHTLTSAAVQAVRERSDEACALVAAGGHGALAPDRQPVIGEVVQVLDASGAVVAAAPPSARSLRLPFTAPGGPGSGATLTEVAAPPGSRADEPWVLVARQVPDGPGGAAVTVVVGRSVAGLAETVGAVGDLVLIGFPLLVLVTGGATFWFTGRALAPVERIRRQVQEISAHRLDERVPVPAVHDEIGRLAQTMNDMLARLDEAHRAQRRFVADAGHELRSPLTTISVALEAAAGRAGADGAWRDLLADLDAETARMRRLVEDLLLLARADEHALGLRHDEVDLDDLLRAEARRLRGQGGLQVSCRVEAVRLHGDRDRLAQVLRNLTDNAARHARAAVHLELAAAGGAATVTVQDDGPGVPAADRRRIFDRFVRLDDARGRATGGSGLGLAIVDEIVAAHGGQVTVDDAPGGGARFRLRLPVAPPRWPPGPGQPPVGSSR